MRMIVFLAAAICVSMYAHSQQSVGIGTTSPNANAILELHSPSGNKGFMMPRLTTAQRQSFGASLTIADAGMMVFDKDLNSTMAWTGSAWKSQGGLTLPFYDSSLTGVNARGAFQIIRNSTGNDGGHLIYLKSMNPQFNGSVIMAESNSDVFPGTAIYGLHTGTGDVAVAGRISNTSNTLPAIYAETNGTGSGLSGNALGTGNSVRGVKQANTTGNAVNGIHLGTSGNAGLFQINNNANTSAALKVENEGSGYGVEIQANQSGNGLQIVKSASATGTNIFAEHQGATGFVANFRRNNTSGTGAALIAYANSSNFNSPAMVATHEGIGDAAIVGRIINNGSPYAAIFAETNGSGSSFFASQLGTGRAGQFQIDNAANCQIALRGYTNGLGKAARMTINNPANADTAIYAETDGSGAALAAMQRGTGLGAIINTAAGSGTALKIQSNSNQNNAYALHVIHNGNATADAVYVEKQTGGGSAGNFQVSNNASLGSALYGQTNSVNGYALGATNVGGGRAFGVFGGGMSVSTVIISGASTSISVRAIAYTINATAAYTLDFTLGDGDYFLFYNNTGAPITVNNVAIPANSGRTCVALGGILRGF